MITFNFSSLKSITDKMAGKKGAWYIGIQIHDGHKYLLDKLRKKVEHVIGIYYVNFYDHMEYIFNGRTIPTMEHVFRKQWLPDGNIISEASKLTDVLYISTGSYNPLKLINVQDIYNQLPDKKIPKYIHKNYHWLALLRIGQAIIKLMSEYNIYDYQMGCIKDCWKYYQKLWSDKYTNIEYELIEPLNDKYGNNISNSKKEMIDKIDRQILKPWMKNIKQANKHIENIEGLEITSFCIDKKLKRIYARIQYEDVFCNESIKL